MDQLWPRERSKEQFTNGVGFPTINLFLVREYNFFSLPLENEAKTSA